MKKGRHAKSAGVVVDTVIENLEPDDALALVVRVITDPGAPVSSPMTKRELTELVEGAYADNSEHRYDLTKALKTLVEVAEYLSAELSPADLLAVGKVLEGMAKARRDDDIKLVMSLLAELLTWTDGWVGEIVSYYDENKHPYAPRLDEF